MHPDVEKLITDEKERKKYQEAIDLAQDALLRSMGKSPKLKDHEDVQKHFAAASQVAYQSYLKTYDANNAKSDEAFKQYRDTCDENNQKTRDASQQVKDGKISYEDYLKIKEANDKANDEAYNKAVEAKKANDKNSQEAYAMYQAIHEGHSRSIKTSQENYEKSNPTTSKPTDTVVQSPEVDKVVSFYKEFFKKDEWYKNNDPKVENGKIHMPFKSDKDAVEFAKKMAESGSNFIMVDKETNKVLAFSQGGKLYQMKDGKPQEFTEPFRPSKEDMEKLPTLEQFQTAPPSIPKPTTKENEFSLSAPTSSNPSGSLPETTIESPKDELAEQDTVKEHISGLGNT
ncbi:Dot/Icm secretion system substrate [Legionella wadsworthii]|uniref:Dot/Icm secretion system substrate n=1 Tax=Legionella wadsworthii TaxID=28088 RepID=A0A378LNG5_9GAMM|nr:hypothetical protein [Legionella wadsworthii]STY28525.1 Dot/Icm secretion system substrate [Legionella wadsworthii]